MAQRTKVSPLLVGPFLGLVGMALVLAALWLPGAPVLAVAERHGELTAAAPPSEADGGQALFLAKGCATCHVHAAVPTDTSLGVGPNLSRYRGDAEFLRRWLRDPPAVRPGTAMPNLRLRPEEIDALIVFLQTRVQ